MTTKTAAERVEYHHNWYLENRERIAERQRAYRRNNKKRQAEWGQRWYQENRERVRATTQKYQEEHREEIAARQRRHYLENKDLYKERARRARGVLSAATRPRPTVCEACGAAVELVFDHDHATGLFRGWLCGPCNRMLGNARDDAARLRAGADYLERWQCASPQEA